MNQGIYEELVTQLVSQKINELDREAFLINKTSIDKAEAAALLSQHLSRTIKHALDVVKGDNKLGTQIAIANKLIGVLNDELEKEDFEDDLVAVEGEILKAVFSKVDAHFSDFDLHLKEN